MTTYYAMTDLHGRMDLFVSAQIAIANDIAANSVRDFKVIMLGDYIDRGPESAMLLTTMRMLQEKSDHWIFLKGNHEEMAIDAVLHDTRYARWLSYGGVESMLSFQRASLRPHMWHSGASELLAWADTFPLYHETESFIFCHAGVNYAVDSLDQMSTQDLLWSRPLGKPDELYKGKHVVHGHTPHRTAPVSSLGTTNLDSGCYASDYLVIGVFNDAYPGRAMRIFSVDKSMNNGLKALF